MADMFGAPVGYRLGEQDNDARMLHGLSAVEAMGKIALQPAQQEHVLAQTANLNALSKQHLAEAGLKENELEATKRFAAAMQGMGQGGGMAGGDSPGAQYIQMGNTALASGLYTKGLELVKTGALLDQRKASAERAAAQTELANMNMMHKEAKELGGIMATVTNPATYQRALMQAASRNLDISGFPQTYDPEYVNAVSQGSMTAAEQSRLRMQELEYKLHQTNAEDQRQTRAVTRDLSRARTSYTRAREEKLQKNGGTGVIGEPSTAATDAARALIKKEYPNLDDASTAARNIASRARVMVRENAGLDIAQATQRAYNEAKTAGEFVLEGGIELPVIGTKVGQKQKYIGGGRTPETAIPLPMKDGKPVASALVKNKHYYSPKGVAVWDGKAMKLIPGIASPSSAADPGDDDDED